MTHPYIYTIEGVVVSYSFEDCAVCAWRARPHPLAQVWAEITDKGIEEDVCIQKFPQPLDLDKLALAVQKLRARTASFEAEMDRRLVSDG